MKKVLGVFHSFILKYRVPISGWGLILAGVDIYFHRVQPHGLFSLEAPQGPVGLGLVVAGMLLRSWSAGVVRKQQVLATGGPYALFRHPLYVGSALFVAGLGLIVDHRDFYLNIVVVVAAVYWPLIRHEEGVLATRFGKQWQAYRQRTGLLFPKVLPGSLRAPWSLAQWRHNGEIWGISGAALCLALLENLHHARP